MPLTRDQNIPGDPTNADGKKLPIEGANYRPSNSGNCDEMVRVKYAPWVFIERPFLQICKGILRFTCGPEAAHN